MDKETASLVGPILSFISAIIGIVVTGYTTMYATRLKEKETVPDKKKHGASGKIAPRPMTEGGIDKRPPLSRSVKAAVLFLGILPFSLGAEYYLLGQSYPGMHVAAIWTGATGLLMILAVAILGILSGGFRDLLASAQPLTSTWRFALIATAIAFLFNVLFIVLYDSGHLPFARNATFQVTKHELKRPYHNTSNSTLLITISAVNRSGPAYTMYASVAASPDMFSQPNGATTVAATSFAQKDFLSSMTFLVPRGQWYFVSTDGGAIDPVVWTEYLL